MASYHAARLLWPLALALVLVTSSAGAEPQAFPSPDEAARTLIDASRAGDQKTLRDLVDEDSAGDVLELGDPGREQRLARFAEIADQRLELREDGPDRVILVIGYDAYPFPVPIVKTERGWIFDGVEGREELLDRVIGWNELIAISVLGDYVDAQIEYASEPRDGTPVRKFATHFLSTPGTRDGLYWEVDEEAGEGPSPFGPIFEKGGEPTKGAPYYGYRYRIFTAQDENAPGGAYSYVINDNLVAGFAAVAWPARYDKTGVMTFLVNHYGTVYQKDLGPDTEKLAAEIRAYGPDESWGEAATD